jgi:hypothetical protein
MMYENTKAEVIKKSQRVPLHLVTPAGMAHEAIAMRDGLLKYGYASYLNPDMKMNATEMLGAAMRHIQRLLGGEDLAPDSRAHHAGHAKAMLGIYLEVMEAGRLVDDRHPTHLAEPHYIGAMFDRMYAENSARDAERAAAQTNVSST